MKGLAQKGWDCALDIGDFIQAVAFATGRGGYAKIGRSLDRSLILSTGSDGFSVSSANLGMDIPWLGSWDGAIKVDGPMIAGLAPKLSGPVVRLQFADGALLLNGTRVPAEAI